MSNLQIWNAARRLEEKRYMQVRANVTDRRAREIRQVYIFFSCAAFIVHYVSPISLIHEMGHAIGTILTGGYVREFTLSYVDFTSRYPDIVFYGGVAFHSLFWGVLSRYLIKSRRSMVGAAFAFGFSMAAWSRWLWYIGMTAVGYETDFSLQSDLGKLVFTALHFMLVLPFARLGFIHYMLAYTWAGEDAKHMENPSLFKKGQTSKVPAEQGKPRAVGIAKWAGRV